MISLINEIKECKFQNTFLVNYKKEIQFEMKKDKAIKCKKVFILMPKESPRKNLLFS